MNEEKFIKDCFEKLEKDHPEKFTIAKLYENSEEFRVRIPESMRYDDNPHNWKLIEADIRSEEITKLEEKHNIKLPSLYKEFVSAYYFMFEKLNGVLDNFNYEDDVKVYAQIYQQTPEERLGNLEFALEDLSEIVELGYIPIGDFNGWGPLCFDTLDNNSIVWLDHDEYYDCESREEMEDVSMKLFNNFKEFMECFFCGLVHDCDENE